MPDQKPIPKFESEDQERQFWANYDSSDYIDWGKSLRAVFYNLKPSTRRSR